MEQAAGRPVRMFSHEFAIAGFCRAITMYGWKIAEELRDKGERDRFVQDCFEKLFPEDVWSIIMAYLDGDVYCKVCDMALRGAQAWSDHKRGKKHKKNCQKQQAAIGCASRTPSSTMSTLKFDDREWLRSELWVLYVRCAVNLERKGPSSSR